MKFKAFRRFCFFAMFAVGASANAWSQRAVAEAREAYGFSVNFSLGSLGVGGLFPFGVDGAGLEASVSVLDIGVEHNQTNLGFTFSPFSVFSRGHGGDFEDFFSVFNLNLYWNALSHRGVFFGPFVSIGYMFFDEAFRWDRHAITAGLRGGFRMETDRVNLHFFSVETGFRLVDGTSNFFVGAKIDLLPLLASWFFRGSWWIQDGHLW